MYAFEFKLICGSCHIRNVLVGVEYRNCCRTLDFYLSFAAWIGQSQSKLIHTFVTYGHWTGQFVSYKAVIYFSINLPKQNRKEVN